MADQQLQFRVSSGLKNIIGKDLITDDFIAVFELVKNSFDAYAKEVTITFDTGKIKIQDDGKGMDIDDIKNKWLFLAYSAKKEGIEDDELKEKEFESYRDKIQIKRYFAGSKGIGRFSCDRLGRKLILTTRKASSNSQIEQIEVNWDEFDEDSKKEFLNINVKHRTLLPNNPEYKNLKHGTILEIYRLNSSWDIQKKLDLRVSLEKLINPFENATNNKFKIFLKDGKEEKRDKEEKDPRKKVNGEVKNFVFETLNLKTTQVITEIDEKGDYITISLLDRGTFVYKIRKPNELNPKLSNIRINLFFLNRAAKVNFSKLMGLASYIFGSVFVYKNGVRIAPYGDFGVDYFGIDSRHAQGLYRTLGLRDIIGRIEILGDNSDFIEISSRDGGLVKNDSYKALLKFFSNFSLIRLERYVINVLWQLKNDKDEENTSLISKNFQAKSNLLNIITSELADDLTELEEVDTKFINLRTEALQKEADQKEIDQLKLIADRLGRAAFKKEVRNTEKEIQKIKELEEKLKKEEEERAKAEEEKKKLEEQLELEKEKNTYLRTSSRTLSEDAKGLVHNIKITTKAIKSNVDTLYEKIIDDKIKQEEILKRLSTIKFNAEKALKISMLITRSNFKTQQNEQIVDVAQYITQYIDIYSQVYEDSNLEFKVITDDSEFIRKVSLLDISVILDDLISNSDKAGAKKVLLEMRKLNNNSLELLFSDDGKGVPKRFLDNPEEIFELGVTTTDGSGIGLNMVKTALKSMRGTINFLGNGIKLKGACFKIIFE